MLQYSEEFQMPMDILMTMPKGYKRFWRPLRKGAACRLIWDEKKRRLIVFPSGKDLNGDEIEEAHQLEVELRGQS